MEVELGLAGRDQLGQRPSDSAATSKTIERKPRREVQAMHARDRADQWVGVGRHRVGMADELHDACLAYEWEASRSPRQ